MCITAICLALYSLFIQQKVALSYNLEFASLDFKTHDNRLSPVRRQAIIWATLAYCQMDHSEIQFNYFQNTLIFILEISNKDIICNMSVNCLASICWDELFWIMYQILQIL